MMRTIAAALALAVVASHAAGTAREPGMNSNQLPRCDRACLYGFADQYLAALVKKDPSRLPWADHVVFTENSVQLAVGDGAWNTVDGKRDYDLKMADPSGGQVAWFGVIEEHGVPAIMALRLKIVNRRIAEVESIITRKVENSPFPSIDTYVTPRPLMLADVPPAQRTPRARMISLADGYFDTLQLNDGKLFTQFTDNCDRVENGLQTTHNVKAFPNYPIAAFGCREQFEKGQYKYDDRLRHRRFPLVDEEKGLVLAGGFIDHKGKLVDFTWTDGTPAKSLYHSPHSYALLEAFKIVDGRIAGVEAVFVDVPYHMPSPWPLEEEQ
jgi:hypothetical protein